MKAFTFAAAAGLLAIGLTGAAVAGEVKAPTMLSDAQMGDVVAGVTWNVYVNNGGQLALKLPGEHVPGNWFDTTETVDCSDDGSGSCIYDGGYGYKEFVWNTDGWED